MNFFDLVFSDNRSIRFRRHLLFWSAWFLYMVATYLIPTNWIPGWNIRGPMPHIEKYGITLALLRILMAGFLLTVVHMALVYGILYYFLPRYFSKSRQRFVTTLLLILFVCVIAFINYFNFVLSMYISTRIGYFETMPGIEFIVPLWARQILFNYPTVVGFALAIKLLKNWYLKQSEVAQAVREKINAELQLLKAQVHPHFLFNTLNNIYSFIINDSPAAPDAIKKLSTLLRYFIYECNQPLVKLEKELRMIRGYIDLEKIRYGHNFNLKLQFKGNAHDSMISPLLLIPFLENSFKHGASQMLTHPWVNLNIIIDEETFHFDLSNSRPTWNDDKTISKGLGLANVKKRLSILYPGKHSLEINEDLMSYSVSLSIPLFKSNEIKGDSIKGNKIYELV